MKKTQFRKIVFLLALSATPSVYASELSMTPFGVANAVQLDISFTNSTGVVDMGFSSTRDQDCSVEVAATYQGVTPFALVFVPPPPTKQVAYFNGHLPWIAAALCVSTSGTIALDGMNTDQGPCTVAGCYSYTCDHVGGSITGITPLDPAVPFAATCP